MSVGDPSLGPFFLFAILRGLGKCSLRWAQGHNFRRRYFVLIYRNLGAKKN